MNKNYTLLGLLMLAVIFGNSQERKVSSFISSNNEEMKLLDKITPLTEKGAFLKSKAFNNKAFGDTLFYEDFNGGLPAGWSIVNNNSGINNFSWLWDTIAKNGQSTTGLPFIQSTTAANGFMSLPSDFYNTPRPPQGSVGMDTYFQSDTISITPQNSVWVSYQQMIIYCCRDAVLTSGTNDVNIFLQVSTDNFATFTNFLANDDIPSNAYVSNGRTNIINISSAVRNASDFQIRFYGRGLTNYVWYIDDFAVIEGPMNDLALIEEKMEFNWDNHVFNPFYGQIPYELFPPLPFSGTIINNGGVVENTVRLRADVSHVATPTGGPGIGLVYSNTSAMDTIGLDTSAFALTQTPRFVPTVLGEYQVDFLANSNPVDQNLGNETGVLGFFTTDTIQAKDDDGYGGGVGTGSYVRNGQSGGTAVGDQYGTKFIFEPRSNLTAQQRVPTSITFGVSTDAMNIGVEIVPKAWEFSEDSLFSSTVTSLDQAVIGEVASSFIPYTVTAADTGTLLTLPFDNGPAFFNGLDSGKQYIFGYEVTSINGGASNFEVFNDFTSSLLQPGFNTFLNFGHAPGWGTTGDNPVIRVNFGNLPISTSIANNQVSNVEFDVLPNPNNGEIKLNISTTSPIAYNLNIRNMLGQVVYNDIINVNGNKTERLDLSNVEKGIYFVSLENGNDKLVKKVIVK